MSSHETDFKARLGENVVFWNRGKVDFEKKPQAATVIGVGLNMRLDLFVYYLGPLHGGGRPFGHVMGAYPGDVEATGEQLTDSGSWVPLEVYWAEMELRDKIREKKEEAERAAALAEKEAKNKPAAKKDEKPPDPPPAAPPAPPVPTTPPDAEQAKPSRKIQPVNS